MRVYIFIFIEIQKRADGVLEAGHSMLLRPQRLTAGQSTLQAGRGRGRSQVGRGQR